MADMINKKVENLPKAIPIFYLQNNNLFTGQFHTKTLQQ